MSGPARRATTKSRRLRHLAEWLCCDDYFGCAFRNAIVDGRNQDESLQAIAFAHNAQVLEQLRTLAACAARLCAPQAMIHQGI